MPDPIDASPPRQRGRNKKPARDDVEDAAVYLTGPGPGAETAPRGLDGLFEPAAPEDPMPTFGELEHLANEFIRVFVTHTTRKPDLEVTGRLREMVRLLTRYSLGDAPAGYELQQMLRGA